jgi:hypothetical protein
MKRETTISKLFLEEKNKIDEEAQKKTTNTSTNTNKKIDEKDIMREIELKTEKKVLEKAKGNTEGDASTILQSIMSDGAKEFKEKTGRHMTYSEMREMFG